jgi:hypothetical protein
MRSWEDACLQNSAKPIPILDWVDEVAPRAVEWAKSRAPDLLLCSDFTAPLGIRVREEVRTPMCLINATYYVGPGSRRRLERGARLLHAGTPRWTAMGASAESRP